MPWVSLFLGLRQCNYRRKRNTQNEAAGIFSHMLCYNSLCCKFGCLPESSDSNVFLKQDVGFFSIDFVRTWSSNKDQVIQFSCVTADRNYTLPSLSLMLPSTALAKVQGGLGTSLLAFCSTHPLSLQSDGGSFSSQKQYEGKIWVSTVKT